MNALPFACPPGISRRKWEGWGQSQRRAALRVYWGSLPEITKTALERKYGQQVKKAGLSLRREVGQT